MTKQPGGDKAALEAATQDALGAKALEGVQTVKLEHPVEFGKAQVVELVFQQLKGRHLREMPMTTDNMSIGTLMEIGAKMTGQPDQVWDDLHPADLTRALEVVNGFLLVVLQTGARPSPA